MIRVLIADDHRVVAEGLRYLVDAQSDMEVVACVDDGDAACRAARKCKPDVVLMDFSMPGLNGAEATRTIVEEGLPCRVIVLSMYADSEYVRRAMQAGALGYVIKRSAATEVVNAIRVVHGGRRFLSDNLADILLKDYASGAANVDPIACLSRREREVLQLLAEGRSTVEISQRLSLSPKTVETYRARLMEKTGIRDIAGLVRFAIQHRIIQIE